MKNNKLLRVVSKSKISKVLNDGITSSKPQKNTVLVEALSGIKGYILHKLKVLIQIFIKY